MSSNSALNVSTAAPTNDTVDATAELLQNLIPALMKTFLVILAGYIFGKTDLYPKENAGAIGRLCGTLLLPVSMFNAMATLVVTEEAWQFLYAVAICKGSIFFVVLGVLLLVDRKVGRTGRAAIWSVFSTQSNDFALGLPIFQVLYQQTNPGYIYFLYIVAPVNLVVLNPIAFILMEYSKKKADGKKFDCKSVGMVLKRVFTNPLVLLTFLGLILRLALWEPASNQSWYADYVEVVLDVVSSAFTGCALFSLGLLIVGKFQLLKKNSPIQMIMFILVKSLLLPIMMKLILDVLNPGNSSLSTAGFLYGIIPTASGVFTYCLQFGMNPDIIAISMVIGTIASAPLMLALGSMVAIATDPTFDFATFGAAAPFFKMIPAAFSIIGCIIFVFASFVHCQRMVPVARVYRTCMLVAVVLLIACYACLYPCQLTLIEYVGANDTSPLFSPGAQTLFMVNFFALTFYRCMVSALALASCMILKERIAKGRDLLPAEQTSYIIKIIMSVLAVVSAVCLFLGFYTQLEADSCVTPFTVVTSAVSGVCQLTFLIVNLVSLVWYGKLKTQLSLLPEFRDNEEDDETDGLAVDEDIEDVQLDMMPVKGRKSHKHGDNASLLENTDRQASPSAIQMRSLISSDLDEGLGDQDDTDMDTYGNNNDSESSKTMDKEPELDVSKDHPSAKYLSDRNYHRRYAIIVYETFVCLMSCIVLLLGIIDNPLLTTDAILLAVAFLLALCTYSSGIVVTVALGFPLIDCKRRRATLSMDGNWAKHSKTDGMAMDF